jgi:hypothetical protein
MKTINIPTEEQILQAASTSDEARQALQTLFPELFEPQSRFIDLSQFDSRAGLALEALRKSDDYIVNSLLALGLAPTEELKGNSIYLSGNGPRKSVCVFDEDGNEVYTGNKIFVAFEK